MRFINLSLEKFWTSVEEEYPAICRESVNVLLQFSTSYMYRVQQADFLF
jgi:hypothetical protein